jgi:hypothetical protein
MNCDILLSKIVLVEMLVQNEDTFNTYSFFEFRSVIEHRKDLFSQPAGVYCEGQSFKKELPTLPDTFSYNSVIKLVNDDEASLIGIGYDGQKKVIRLDFPGEVQVVADFNSGVYYTINQELNTCTYDAINSEFVLPVVVKPVRGAFGTLYDISSPNQMFYLDDSAFYAGLVIYL